MQLDAWQHGTTAKKHISHQPIFIILQTTNAYFHRLPALPGEEPPRDTLLPPALLALGLRPCILCSSRSMSTPGGKNGTEEAAAAAVPPPARAAPDAAAGEAAAPGEAAAAAAAAAGGAESAVADGAVDEPRIRCGKLGLGCGRACPAALPL